MSKLLEKIAEVAQRDLQTEDNKFYPSHLRAAGRGFVSGMIGNAAFSLPGAILGSKGLTTVGALVGTAAGASDGWNASMRRQKREHLERQKQMMKSATLTDLVNSGVDFNSACEMVKEAEGGQTHRDQGAAIGGLIGIVPSVGRALGPVKPYYTSGKGGVKMAVPTTIGRHFIHSLNPLLASIGAGYYVGSKIDGYKMKKK